MNTTLKNFIKIGLFPLAVYLLNEFFWRVFYFWYRTNGVDSYFHFAGGVSIAFAAYQTMIVLEKIKIIEIKRKLLKAFLIISVVAFAAVTWEIYEFLWDNLIGTNFHQPTVYDTMKDLILGMLGGTIFSSVIFLRPQSTDRSRERNTLANMLSTGDPAYDTLKSDTETRMRN